jgi:hypothetical protein
VVDIREQEMIAAPDRSFGEGKAAGNPLGARLRRHDLHKVGVEDDGAPGHTLSPPTASEVQQHGGLNRVNLVSVVGLTWQLVLTCP